jgi:hypothetical protein
VFAVVNAAAYKTGAKAGVRRPIAAAGAIACAISFVILTAQSARQDPTSLIVLVVLLLGVLIAEHGVLKHRRPIAPSAR